MTIETVEKAVTGTYIPFIKAHETLLIIVLAALLGWHFYGTAINAWVDHDKRVSTAAALAEASAEKSNTDLKTQLAALQTQISTQAVTLQKAIDQNNKNNQTQKQTNDTMTEVQLSAHWAQLISVKPEEVTYSPVPNTLQVSDNAAHATVDRLDDGKTCAANLIITNQELADQKTIVAKQQGVILSDADVLTKEKTSHADDVKTLNAEKKQEFRRGFKWGSIVMFIPGLIIGHRF
jgi:hypothetical protein